MGDVSLEKVKAHLEEIDRVDATRHLLKFAKRVYPKFESPPHIEHLAKLLERVEQRSLRFISVSCPVRHGKSVICSQVFPAYYIGRHPDEMVGLASHSLDLAVLHSRAAKNIVEGDRWPFPDIRLSQDSQSVQRWNVTQGGGMYAVGVGGAITGRGFNVLLIDDALHDALSEAERETAWKWFTEVAVPRVEPGGAIICVNARFAIDDIPGRIMDSPFAHEWEFVEFPAIAVEGDVLGREVGEPLWPERMGLEELQRRKEFMGGFAFSAQFQQDPIPSGGVIFLDKWLERTYDIAPTNFVMKVMSVDSAWKTGPQNDYSVIATWGLDGKDYYLLDVLRGKWEFPDLQRHVVAKYGEQKPNAVLVEAQQSGLAVLQQLQASTGIPLVPMNPKGTKGARAQAVTPLFESGKVVLPKSAPWLDAWKNEHLRFSGDGGRQHDDQVDTSSMALDYLSRLIRVPQADYSRYKGWMER